MTFGYPTSDSFGLTGQRSTLGLRLTAIRRGFELYECKVIIIIIIIIIILLFF